MEQNQTKVIQARMTSDDIALIGVCISGLGYAMEAGRVDPAFLEMTRQEFKDMMGEMLALNQKLKFIMQEIMDERQKMQGHPQGDAGTRV